MAEKHKTVTERRISDLVRSAIKNRLPRVEPERSGESDPGFEWAVPYRGGRVYVPEIAFRGCRDLDDAILVVEAFLDAFSGGLEVERFADDGANKRDTSLDAAFAPHAAIEALIVSAVPAGTSITRAVAGGDLGWRIGAGWMSVEGSDSSRPEQIRDFARSLAAIPVAPGEKPRAGDLELVAKTLAAGRSM